MNPVVGDALEAAREAEAALQALEHAAKVARGETGDEDDASAGSSSAGGSSGAKSSSDAYAKSASGPIHRVEIEATELVPAHSGRAQRGFVARIHRRANGNAANAPASANASPSSSMPQASMHSAPESHVFSNHNDLTNFLHDQFAEDCQ
jgi:hypothetical protein